MDIHRQKFIDTLQTRVRKDSAIKYEKYVYEMCLRISSRNGATLEDVYADLSFEKLGELMTATTKQDRLLVLKDIKSDTVGFDTCTYDIYRKEEDDAISKSLETPKVEKGAFKCRNRKCGSEECYFYSEQRRSADEGMTTFVVCTKCNGRYRA